MSWTVLHDLVLRLESIEICCHRVLYFYLHTYQNFTGQDCNYREVNQSHITFRKFEKETFGVE